VKMTEGGRTVYGGGGITPDEKYETPVPDKLQITLYRSGLFNFTRSYFGTHPTSLPKDWMPNDDTLSELKTYLQKNGTPVTDAEFARHHDWIRRFLAREMYTAAFNVDESDRMFSQTDPEVEKAVEALPKSAALQESAKKIVVQRMNGQR